MKTKSLLKLSRIYKQGKEFNSQVRIVLSDRPIEESFNVNQKVSEKPHGLWYAFGGTWIDFVSREMQYKYNSYNYVYMIDVDLSKIVQVPSTIEAVASFSDKYKQSISSNIPRSMRPRRFNHDSSPKRNHNQPKSSYLEIEDTEVSIPSYDIKTAGLNKKAAWDSELIYELDWSAVAKDYSGFETKIPYDKGARGKCRWWGTVDVPSGCIWDSSCIKEITLLGGKEKREDEEDLWHLENDEGKTITRNLVDEIDYSELDRSVNPQYFE